MAPCQGCKQPIDTTAKVCPKCGRPNPARRGSILGVAIGVLLIPLTCVAGVSLCGGKTSRTTEVVTEDKREVVTPKRPGDYAGVVQRPAECEFLRPDGMPTGAWKKQGSEYTCLSTYDDIGNGPSNIAYYVYGAETSARRLELVLNVNDPAQTRPAYRVMGERSGSLLGRVMADRVNKGRARVIDVEKGIVTLAKAIDAGQTGQWVVGGITIDLQREKFPKKGHSVKLTAALP